MNTTNLIERASELTDKIYKHMTRVEQCEALIEKVSDLSLVFLDKNGTAYVTFDTVIDSEQMDELRAKTIELINENKSEAEQFLKNLVGDQEEKAAVVEEIPEEIPEEKTEEKAHEVDVKDLDIKKVKEALKSSASYRVIADRFGVDYKKFYRFLEANNLKRPKEVKGEWRG